MSRPFLIIEQDLLAFLYAILPHWIVSSSFVNENNEE